MSCPVSHTLTSIDPISHLLHTGETIKIIIEEYVQHLSGYFLQLKFDPELLFRAQFQYHNRIAVEFNHLYHWHPLMPDSFKVGSQEYSYEQFLFNTSMLMDYGVEALVDAFSRQRAGRVSFRERVIGAGSGIPQICSQTQFPYLWDVHSVTSIGGCEYLFMDSLIW